MTKLQVVAREYYDPDIHDTLKTPYMHTGPERDAVPVALDEPTVEVIWYYID